MITIINNKFYKNNYIIILQLYYLNIMLVIYDCIIIITIFMIQTSNIHEFIKSLVLLLYFNIINLLFLILFILKYFIY